MYFFEPLYRWLVEQYDGRINHFPLIRLLLFSLDHAMLLFLGWLFVWSVFISWKKWRGDKIAWRWEGYRHAFVFYILLLFQFTVFRQPNPFERIFIIEHSWRDIYWVPLVDSLKLFYRGSMFAAYYNVLGNVICFIPLGLFCGMLYGEEAGYRWSLWGGLSISLVIEVSQFLFMTGVTHIDDLLCNVLGSIIGFGIYRLYQKLKRRRLWSKR